VAAQDSFELTGAEHVVRPMARQCSLSLFTVGQRHFGGRMFDPFGVEAVDGERTDLRLTMGFLGKLPAGRDAFGYSFLVHDLTVGGPATAGGRPLAQSNPLPSSYRRTPQPTGSQSVVPSSMSCWSSPQSMWSHSKSTRT